MNHAQFSSFRIFVFMLLCSLTCNAATYMGEITVEVGKTRTVSVGYSSSGTWSKTNSTFIFVSQGSTSCEIKGNQVGTGILYYYGVASAADIDLYWTINVVAPVFPQLTADPPGGEISKGTTVKLYANGKGAEWSYDEIYYTLDGNDPKASVGSRYSYQGIVINESCTLRAIGMKWNGSSYEYGKELKETYTIKLPKLTLSASPYELGEPVDAGTIVYLNTPNVTGADIYYTLDGTIPSKNSKKYSSSGITIKDFCRLKAVAFKEGYESSDVRTWRYGINQHDISIDATNFPDVKFRNYLLGLQIGKDGILTAKEILNEESKSPYNKGISNLKGIEYFPLLSSLHCGLNNLSSIDLRSNRYLENLQCQLNNLSSIDLSENILLKSLYCVSNSLTSLDVSKNTELITLDCYLNKLTSLDVTKNTALTKLNCSSNQLTSIDVSKNTELETLECSNNQLSSLIAPNSEDLTIVTCSKNYIKDAAMDALISSLPINTSDEKHYFRVISNQGNTIDNNVCTKTQVAAAKAKGWTPQYWSGSEWLDYEGSEEFVEPIGIDVNATNFPDVNFRNYLLSQSYGLDGVLTDKEIKEVTYINVNEKNISSLKGIEFFTALERLAFSYNQLTSLDVSKNTALTFLTCYNNQLTSLDLSNNTALEFLACVNNQLTSLDISKNTALTELYCAGNQLTSLDVSKNTTLTRLWCFSNQIKGTSMDNLISSLPQNTSNDQYEFCVINPKNESEGNVCTKTQVAAVKARGWFPCYYDGKTQEHVEYEGSEEVKPINIVLPSTATVVAGETITLTPEIAPENTEYTLTWSSKDEAIATVDQNGVVTGVKKGQTFIIVETDNGKKAYCKLTVTAPVPIRIELPEDATVYVGKTITLTPTITPEGAETTLTWKSDDKSVVTVESNGMDGVLTGVAEGLALVTVSTANGLTSDACMVKVEPDPSGIKTVMIGEKTGAPVYSLSGQRLAAPRKGVNIVGGRKIVIK